MQYISPYRALTKVYSRGVLLSALMDSGNLFGDLISEKLARTLSLKILGTARTVGTASAKGPSKTISDISRKYAETLLYPPICGQRFCTLCKLRSSFSEKK